MKELQNLDTNLNKMEKVVSKGYTLKVTSWENDGDNYRTKFIHSESKEEIEALCRICDLASRKITHTPGGIGNEMDEEKVTRIAVDFFEKDENKFSLTHVKDQSKLSDDEYFDLLTDYTQLLFGSSEYYICRVCEEYTVTYSPEDIYVDLIEHKRYR